MTLVRQGLARRGKQTRVSISARAARCGQGHTRQFPARSQHSRIDAGADPLLYARAAYDACARNTFERVSLVDLTPPLTARTASLSPDPGTVTAVLRLPLGNFFRPFQGPGNLVQSFKHCFTPVRLDFEDPFHRS
jgi:hypothetical protein